MQKKIVFQRIIFNIFLVLLSSYTVYAQTIYSTQVEEKAFEISQDIISPFCPGLTLKDCPSSQAKELKEQIKERLSKGESESEIFDSIVKKYGENIRAMPTLTGFGLFAWILPPAVFMVGIIIIFLWLQNKKKKL